MKKFISRPLVFLIALSIFVIPSTASAGCHTSGRYTMCDNGVRTCVSEWDENNNLIAIDCWYN